MIDTVISYCTNDFRFIKSNIQECKKFSNKIIIPIADHLLDGTPEDENLLKETLKLSDDRVIFYNFEWKPINSSRYWHNVDRFLGHSAASADYVLHIDADEIFDGDLMKLYIENQDYKNYDVVSFESYWYFRDPIYRATSTEQAGVLYKKDLYTLDNGFTEAERWWFRSTNLKILEHCTYQNKVMMNHYSWVRTEDRMINKVKSWGHNKDKNWIDLVKSEFSHPFNGTDFVHGYQYEIVDNKFNI
jgi:hypothetical protein